jgi:glycosyltransferase involved in cell wall biosynthesis
MPRVIFLCPFGRSEITGGIKNAYRQAELLEQAGVSAFVYQAEGPPSWFSTTARVLREPRLAPLPDDVLVFPETLNGMLAELVQAPLQAKKVLYCQAHYYALFNSIAPERLPQLGFARVACQSSIARGFLERVLHLKDVAVIPCYIDRKVFFPREKEPQIAFIPRKLPREAAAIHRILHLKYPNLSTTRWVAVENRSERDTAEIFGRSAVVLSLPFLESFGLVPLEAMASGAVVAGFHGYGGQEYATAENGRWFAPDHLEEAADAVADLIDGFMSNRADVQRMREAGFATAARYSIDATRSALLDFYTPLLR